MEILGGIVAGLVVMALLAGIGLAAIAALMLMAVLYFLTEMDFRKVFLISSGVGLLAPIMLGLAISGAIADGSLERDLRTELGGGIQFPDGDNEDWRQAVQDLRDLSREAEDGNISDEEAQTRAREIIGQIEGLQITVDGDGVTIGGAGDSDAGTDADADTDAATDTNTDSGVPLELPEGVPVDAPNGDSDR